MSHGYVHISFIADVRESTQASTTALLTLPLFPCAAAAYTCPPHSKYSHKMTQCQPTCAEPDAEGDCHEPREGCECQKGYVLSGTECVPIQDCGCFVNTTNGDVAYYPVGVSVSIL